MEDPQSIKHNQSNRERKTRSDWQNPRLNSPPSCLEYLRAPICSVTFVLCEKWWSSILSPRSSLDDSSTEALPTLDKHNKTDQQIEAVEIVVVAPTTHRLEHYISDVVTCQSCPKSD